MVIAVLYLAVFGLLSMYALHRVHLVILHWRLRRRVPAAPARFSAPPTVTVQLPLYDERYVAERLLEAVAALDWPRDRLEIQVLDDSSDDTTALVAARAAELRARGVDVQHLRRGHRSGFKAGALQHGLARARGEFILVLDADFLPPPDLLRRTLDHFTDPGVGMVQARWGHLNRRYSLLTEAQAALLDAHFLVENGARARAGRFFNFSGTAGIWRRDAVEHAGGWQADTLTEDMDLSYRAQLAGWRFVFLPEVTVPAELPVDVAAFKSQQFRWAKGQTQVARKLLPALLRAPLAPAIKLEAFFHLTGNVTYPLALLLSLLAVPAVASGGALDFALPWFLGAAAALAAFYARALWRVPVLMALCAGLALNQTRGVAEALLGRRSGFVRTPKHGVTGRGQGWRHLAYRVPARGTLGELALAAYYLGGSIIAARAGHFATVPFLLLFFAGTLWAGLTCARSR